MTRSVRARLLGHFLGDLRHPGGAHDVGRLVHHVSGHVDAVGQRLALGDALFQRFHLGLVPLDDRQLFQMPLRLVFVLGAVPVKLVEAQRRALGHRLGGRFRREPADARAVGQGSRPGHTEAPQVAGRSARDLPYHVGVEFLLLAQAHHHHALRRQLPPGVKDGRLALLAPDLSVGDQVGDGAIQGLVHGAGAAAGRRDAFEEVYHQGIDLGLNDVTRRGCDLHHWVPSLD